MRDACFCGTTPRSPPGDTLKAEALFSGWWGDVADDAEDAAAAPVTGRTGEAAKKCAEVGDSLISVATTDPAPDRRAAEVVVPAVPTCTVLEAAAARVRLWPLPAVEATEAPSSPSGEIEGVTLPLDSTEPRRCMLRRGLQEVRQMCV